MQTETLLQHRAFAKFWCARMVSDFGFQMLSAAEGWQIYAISGRALDLRLIGLVQFVPSLLLALPDGQCPTRRRLFRRRRADDPIARSAAYATARRCTLAGGVGTLVVVGSWMLLFPGLRLRQRLSLQDDEPVA